jgi:hydroxymethylbilane synthase
MDTIRIGTRASPLAMWQARWVAARLLHAGMASTLMPFETSGDRIQSVSLNKIGSKGVFTYELEQALLTGAIHIAVHSAKDMPSHLPAGLDLLAITEREAFEDCLVSYKPEFSFNNANIHIGTSSTRRKALLAHYAPNVRVSDVRGNLQTRLHKLELGQYDALCLARAGVIRIGAEALIRTILPIDRFTPQAGQGALAIESAIELPEPLRQNIRNALNHLPSETCVRAERAYLAAMDGGCSIPTFALANYVEGMSKINDISLHAGIVSLNGVQLVRYTQSGTDPQQLGQALASQVLANGGAEILAAIRA